MKDELVRKVVELEKRLDNLVKPELGWYPVFLVSALTSASWDGDAYSTTAKTLIDLSAVFGVPAGVHAVLVEGRFRDSDSAATSCYMILGPTNVASAGRRFNCLPVDNRETGFGAIIPCDSNGDIYYQLVASGAGTMDIWMRIRAYWV